MFFQKKSCLIKTQLMLSCAYVIDYSDCKIKPEDFGINSRPTVMLLKCLPC